MPSSAFISLCGKGFGHGLGQPAALGDGVVSHGVVDDKVVLAAEIAHDGDVGGVPAHQHQRVLGVFPLGNGGLCSP